MASIYKRKGKGKWLIAYTDENHKRQTVTGTASKTVTQQIAAKLENEVELRRRGCIDPRLEHYSQAEGVPLVVLGDDGQIVGGHLGDFHKAILAGGNTEKHAWIVRARVAEVIARCGAKSVSDLSPSKVQAAIQELRAKGLSLQSCNHYLRAAKQFRRWLWWDGRARGNPLAHLQGYNVKLDRRHYRRALSIEDFGKLVEAAERGPTVLGMAGPDRAMLYHLAVHTGFRANELRSLVPESFDLDNSPPSVTVEAGYSKHRKKDVQPIRPDLAAMLRPWLADKKPKQPVFNVPQKTAKMMRADLAEAGIPYKDSAELVADFHSLRHSAGTWLNDAGVHPKAIQTFMRHSTITLTMDRYVHPSVTGQAAALEHLPATISPAEVQQIRSAQTRQRAG